MTTTVTAQEWVERLDLVPHPEGGFYREVYRSPERIPPAGLPERFPGARRCCTAIYYLLEPGQFSAFHRIRSDELWHWYAGGPLEVIVLEGTGSPRTLSLGPDGGFMQVVPARCWFAARCPATSPYGLVGCTVAPGFDFDDFELADRDRLTAAFPDHAELIQSLTR